jgi:hypothetical protein
MRHDGRRRTQFPAPAAHGFARPNRPKRKIGSTMSLGAAPGSARPRRRLIRPVVAAAMALGLAPWGCGGTPSSDPDASTRRAARPAPTAPAGGTAARARSGRARSTAVSHTTRANRLREFRRWIVWRFRIRGAAHAAAARENPLDQLRRSLSDLYGRGARARPPDLSSV